jgi:hypothetical protein
MAVVREEEPTGLKGLQPILFLARTLCLYCIPGRRHVAGNLGERQRDIDRDIDRERDRGIYR